MPKRKQFTNPFYVLLILAGLAFLVTACTYGVMTYRTLDAVGVAAADEHPLMTWIDEHGMMLMLVQVLLIGVFSVVAMMTDKFWESLGKEKTTPDHSSNEGANP